MLRERLGTALWKRAARVANARFRTELEPDADGPLLLLSPHLDDAVLDCWSVLSGPREVEVVNVFALAPPQGTATQWDRVVGAGDSAALFAARIAEDAEALSAADRTPRNLPFLELQYRRGQPLPSWRAIDRAIAAVVPRVAQVLAPITLGGVHPDHALVRGYALALARQGHAVSLYADAPYACEYGWPPWVTGAEAIPHLDVDAFWAPTFSQLPVEGHAARVVALDEGAASAKLEAMRTYRTQFATLDRGPVARLSNPAVHPYELFWDVPQARPT